MRLSQKEMLTDQINYKYDMKTLKKVKLLFKSKLNAIKSKLHKNGDDKSQT